VVSWTVLVILVSGVSALLTIAGFPSPLLFGGLLAGLVFALTTGRDIAVPGWAVTIAQAIIGVIVGAAVDFGTLADLGGDWPVVLAISVLTVVLSVVVGQLLRLHRGVTPLTASFASVAGGASGITAVARELGADDRVVTVIQYLRVLVVLLAMPAAVSTIFDADTGTGAEVVGPVTTTAGIVYSVLAVVLGVVVGRVLHLPSPAVLGALLASVALRTVPAFSAVDVPAWIQGVGFLLIGLQVGLRFTVDSLRTIGRMLPTALLVIAIIVGVCAAFGLLLAELTGVSRLDAYLATTPGGLYAVLATSADTGGDVTFVTAMQLIRLLLVLLAAPLLGRWLNSRGS
jgi:membrane AbrB-like protein